MLQITKLPIHGFSCNSYFLTNGGAAVVIDPGERNALEALAARNLKAEYVLLTHGHFDHIRGCHALQEAGAKIGCLKGEEETALFHNLGEVYGDGPVPPFRIDFTFEDGEKLQLCGICFSAISTPGHSKGGCSLLVETSESPYAPGVLFTGDTLFRGSVGRTDGPGASEKQLQASLKKLCALEKNYFVFPGHGGASTLAEERAHNGYIVW